MKPADNIEETIKKELNFSAGAETHDRILSDVLQAHENSMKTKSASTMPNLGRQIMKSPITKLAAAAAIIIAISVVINPFGGSVSNVAWADIAERFESVPFFNLTIYNSYDTSAEAMKIEIWKSENSRVRAHQGNNVIFADFADGKEDFIAFDRTTKQPIDDGGLFLIKVILNDLCPEGRFSLNTLINSFPSDDNGLTPVQTADTAASRETVVFAVRHKTTPEWILIWALRESKLPMQVRFRDPRSNECSDIFFNYSEKKDAAFFDPNAFAHQ